ncbi:hypothetical protein [Iningainema tapete]|uniref:Uncharacterized protein n=1 Tax=Iningainema tapete BLCC-T55 TaxID=2748662 RepID=A0A8J7C6A9_9CYAN|nr:hypothetical protein [Iningainema tapete]MBD2774089.1 hypothetical protein [Iningainema tapete BLCC-T55]
MARITISNLNTVQNNFQVLSNTELDATKGGQLGALISALNFIGSDSDLLDAFNGEDSDVVDLTNNRILTGGLINEPLF